MWTWIAALLALLLVWSWTSTESADAAYDRGYDAGWADTCAAIEHKDSRLGEAVRDIRVC